MFEVFASQSELWNVAGSNSAVNHGCDRLSFACYGHYILPLGMSIGTDKKSRLGLLIKFTFFSEGSSFLAGSSVNSCRYYPTWTQTNSIGVTQCMSNSMAIIVRSPQMVYLISLCSIQSCSAVIFAIASFMWTAWPIGTETRRFPLRRNISYKLRLEQPVNNLHSVGSCSKFTTIDVTTKYFFLLKKEADFFYVFYTWILEHHLAEDFIASSACSCGNSRFRIRWLNSDGVNLCVCPSLSAK